MKTLEVKRLVHAMEQSSLPNIADGNVLLAWNNAHSSSCVQDTVTKLKERIGAGHLSLEHVERLQLGINFKQAIPSVMGL